MKISTKGLYALRMLVDLAARKDCGFIPLKEISERQNISKKYLEQIIPIFNNTDILRANRGSQGGYMLGKDPSKLTVGEILRITEGSLSPVECAEFGAGSCDRTMECATFPVWQGLSKVINEYLDSITLQDIVDKQQDSFNYII